MKKTAIISQARMGSTRLPGKIMKEVLGKPMLQYHMDRLFKASAVDSIIVATTVNPKEKPIIDFCEKHHINYFRGSENDVLERYYQTAIAYHADVVIRVTSDCPLLDPKIINELMNIFYGAKEGLDYVCNYDENNRTYPIGMECEILSFACLEKLHQEAISPVDREHVTGLIWRHPDSFRMQIVPFSKNCSDTRLTLDTSEDLELITRIIEVLYPHNQDYTLEDILLLLEKNPIWLEINKHVRHKYLDDLDRELHKK